MEAVSWRLRIDTTTFHTTSMRPMPQYYALPLGIRTTAFQVASSAILPSPKSALTRSTTFSQCVILFSVLVSLSSSISSLPRSSNLRLLPLRLLLLHLRYPLLEVLHSHPRSPPGAVVSKPHHHPIYLFIRRYQVLHLEWIYGYVLPPGWYLAI